ncbi:MAG: hypothetical protein JWN16_2222 [Alphaproteobacteria bacterium]|nr:hypothetical protein [Alphaproteobacteria bacterium]
MTAAQFFPVVASAQPVTRVKAKLVAFDGAVMTLERLPSAPLMKSEAPPPGAAALGAPTLTVSLMPETKFVASEKSAFAAIASGDYVGAVVVEGRGGTLKAQEVYRYAPVLRGTGEGRFTDNNHLLVNGTVTKAEPTTPKESADGTLTLHYRGAVLNGTGKGRTVCEGRAAPVPFASALACSADAVVEVLPGTPVTALTLGDRKLLVPGSIVTVSITKLADRTVAPGVIVEAPSEKTGPLEKPQIRP